MILTPEQQRREEIAEQLVIHRRGIVNLDRNDVSWLLDQLEQVQARERGLREAAENLIEDVDELMAEDLRLHDLQQKIGAVYLGYGGAYNHDDDLRSALAAQSEGSGNG